MLRRAHCRATLVLFMPSKMATRALHKYGSTLAVHLGDGALAATWTSLRGHFQLFVGDGAGERAYYTPIPETPLSRSALIHLGALNGAILGRLRGLAMHPT